MFLEKERAKALLNLLTIFTRNHGGDSAKGAAQMDKELGDMWREEVEKAGLGHEIPSETVKDDTKDKAEAFYKRVKNVLNKNDLPPDLVDDGGVAPCDHSGKPEIKSKSKMKDKVSKIKIMLVD